jgi:hypothetical protein
MGCGEADGFIVTGCALNRAQLVELVYELDEGDRLASGELSVGACKTRIRRSTGAGADVEHRIMVTMTKRARPASQCSSCLEDYS